MKKYILRHIRPSLFIQISQFKKVIIAWVEAGGGDQEGSIGDQLFLLYFIS